MEGEACVMWKAAGSEMKNGMTDPRAQCLSVLFLVLAFTALAPRPVIAATYYVAPDGDDGSPGTFDQPWKTVYTAVRKLQAEDTLYFRGGTDTEAHGFDPESKVPTPQEPAKSQICCESEWAQSSFQAAVFARLALA